MEVLRTNAGSRELVFDLLVDGKPVSVSCVEVADPSHVSLLIQNRSYDVVMEGDVVSAAGVSSQVQVENELQKEIDKVVKRVSPKAGRTELNAPMPGLVVAVEVVPGQKVVRGQGLVVLEAMKMQNELKAPAGGEVKEVLVREGTTVDKGDLLVVLE
ncbi:hypothetical protein AMJ40_05330 [candidate division TA06 bacterium DG_26]|uniref:Lipoyl-binding domain-containing protein n=1 Tax=candidate division TA06 bacterium DG_26 TaxID=1703771 RepID=A0A0S7WHE2_UNCT6|nr:MAG: hypothetical protein AMJ40_05330 [candidate division TA06 bacterium DG_26]